MHDFGHFAYLDLHKTGSSYVSKFLRECCTCKETYFKKHDWVTNDFHVNKFYFISIRNPLSMYSSLYRYGLDRKGDVFGRLKRSNNLKVYDSFEYFVTFLLDSENANILGYGYRQNVAESMGFMSFRFLKLSLQHPMQKITQILKKGEKLESLEQQFITRLEIRTEELNEGLRVFSKDIFPQYFNQISVDRFLLDSEKVNSSKTTPEKIDLTVSDNAMNELKDKEKLLFSRYSTNLF